MISPEEKEKLFSIQFQYTDDIQVSLIKDIKDKKQFLLNLLNN